MFSKKEALKLLQQHIKNKNLIKHCLAVEAIMKELAKHFNEDEEKWGMAGLLHDLDYEYTKDCPEKHGKVALELLKEYHIPDEVKNAIVAHAGNKSRDTLMEKAIYIADPISGFIVAAALISPQKKLNGIDVDFLKRRFKEKAFAKGIDRKQILLCEEIGLSLEQLFEISLNAMKKIAQELGL